MSDVRLLARTLLITSRSITSFRLFTEQRDELREHLQANGISTGIHYPIPVHLQRGFSNLGYEEGDLPETERVCREVLSLPMYPELATETVRRSRSGAAVLQSSVA